MNYLKIDNCDQTNGPGLRVSIFVSGCSLKCKGCFNSESWDAKAGKLFGEVEKLKLLSELKQKHIAGLSILGGDPLEPCNIDEVTYLCKLIKANSNKQIWLWTGHKIDKYLKHEILSYVDVVVDGPFIESLKVEEQGRWFGSSNQRVILVSDQAKDWWEDAQDQYSYMKKNVFNINQVYQMFVV